jgi:hypothetical protein
MMAGLNDASRRPPPPMETMRFYVRQRYWQHWRNTFLEWQLYANQKTKFMRQARTDVSTHNIPRGMESEVMSRVMEPKSYIEVINAPRDKNSPVAPNPNPEAPFDIVKAKVSNTNPNPKPKEDAKAAEPKNSKGGKPPTPPTTPPPPTVSSVSSLPASYKFEELPLEGNSGRRLAHVMLSWKALNEKNVFNRSRMRHYRRGQHVYTGRRSIRASLADVLSSSNPNPNPNLTRSLTEP